MEDLKEFIKTSKTRLQNILNQLEWTVVDKTTQNIDFSSKKNSVRDKEPSLPPSCATENSVIIEENELRLLLNDPTAKIPTKFSDLQLNFLAEQKLLLYEHAIKNTTKQSSSRDDNMDMVEIADIVAIKKREKKKKRKHRVSKPTFIEEVRSLVELQMQALEEYSKNKCKHRALDDNLKQNATEIRKQRSVDEKYSNRKLREQKYDISKRSRDDRVDRHGRRHRRDKSNESESYKKYRKSSKDHRRSRSRERNNYNDRYREENKYRSRKRSRSNSISRHRKKRDRSRSRSKEHRSKSKHYKY